MTGAKPAPFCQGITMPEPHQKTYQCAQAFEAVFDARARNDSPLDPSRTANVRRYTSQRRQTKYGDFEGFLRTPVRN